MIFTTLREKYTKFVYKNYEINYLDDDLNLNFYYEIHGEDEVIDFVHTLSWEDIPKVDIESFETIIFNIGLVEAISYWKLTCSKEFHIDCGYINESQKEWFKHLFYHGLGEFIYINQIVVNQDDFVDFIVNSDKKFDLVHVDTKETNLIPIGGGKDSCVTYELLKDKFEDSYLFAINPIEPTKKIIQNKKAVLVQRVLDKKIIEMNASGYLNGHIPFSAVVSFVSILSALIYKIKYIPLSNEASANEENIIFNDLAINHQYSKSLEYENDIRSYCYEFLSQDIEYFSFLRPLHEIHIASLFSKMPQYFDIFVSCNAGRGLNWCAKCPKCLFTFIMLSAYLDGETMIEIFGSNMLDDESLKQILDELQGYAKTKPFECVGTYDEVNLALGMIVKKQEKLPKLLKNIQIPQKLEFPNIDLAHHNLPEDYLKIIRSFIMNYQNENLPQDAKKVGSTPSMTEKTVFKGILKNHLAPQGKYALVVVEEGSLQFVWEDDKDNILDADVDHPIVIQPERFHYVIITGDVRFRLEFYEVAQIDLSSNKSGNRPGKNFIGKFFTR